MSVKALIKHFLNPREKKIISSKIEKVTFLINVSICEFPKSRPPSSNKISKQKKIEKIENWKIDGT